MKKLTKENCKLVIKNRPFAVIKFGTNWCPPCIKLSKSIETLESEFPQIEFIDIDASADLEYAAEMGVQSVPAVFFAVHGKFLEDDRGKNLRTTDFEQLKSVVKKMISQ